MKKISFVIPCYKSENSIALVAKEIIDTMQTLGRDNFEIILISDHSPDNVFAVIEKLCIQNDKIKGIQFSKNFGQHGALMAGYRHVTGDYVVSLDDDCQCPVDEVNTLIQRLEDGFDVVYAKYPIKQHSAFRNFGSKVNDFMIRVLLEKPKGLYMSSYFIARRFIIDEIVQYKNPYPYIMGLVLRVTKNITNVDVSHREREIGESGYTLKTLLKLWLNGFTAFSVKPLRIATCIGAICAMIGFVFGAFVIVQKILNPLTPAGYSSTMAALLFIGGMIMLMLGLIGEYIGRIYISINNAPQYVIRETINIEDDVKRELNAK